MQPDPRRAKPRLRTTTRVLFLAALAVAALAPPQHLAAQQGDLVRERLTLLGPPIGTIPFHPGEELGFHVKAGMLGGGQASMSVGQIDTIHGFPTLPLEFRLQGRLAGGLFKVDDKFYSWMDTETLVSRRFRKITDHGRKTKEYEFRPEDLLVQRIDYDTTWALPSRLPLDDLSFVYYARTIPLVVGESYTYNRYFKDDGNPVILNVLRRDRVETEAGVFNTIVVQPVIPGSNLFKEGAQAEIHLSDDDRRLVVYMRVTQFWIVPLTMELAEFTPGVPSEPADTPRPAQPARDGGPAGERPAVSVPRAVDGQADGRH